MSYRQDKDQFGNMRHPRRIAVKPAKLTQAQADYLREYETPCTLIVRKTHHGKRVDQRRPEQA
jgi:hypothetical protein